MFTTPYGVFTGKTWEALCQLVFKRKYENEGYQAMPANPGDFGLEGYTIKTGSAFQCYCPEKYYDTKDLYEAQRDKITDDLNKLKKNEKELSNRLAEVEINRETLTPYLAQIELREVTSAKKSDIRTDSSASDFVRLIWSYLIALHQASTSGAVQGNHPGILIFDEPGQHSMADHSQRALLNMLSHERGLQTIVAASFDESEAVFKKATEGLTFKLIEWEGKSIAPLSERTFLN